MKKIILISILIISANSTFCQVGIGTINPNPNAALHISDTAKGLLIPILDSLQRKNIPNTAGLMVYDSTVKSFWYNDGSRWQQVGTKHYAGERYGGGIVFWVNSSGEHGLIAAIADQGTSGLRWDKENFFVTTMAQGIKLGSGKMNTLLIIAKQGNNDEFNIYAALSASQSAVPNNSPSLYDWYLPSRDELMLLYEKRNIIGGFTTNKYWSSTEFDTNPSTSAWCVDFSTGQETLLLKNNFFFVRSIRSF